MTTQILIAEDHESANLSLQKTLEQLGIAQADYAYYCDDALAAIKNAKARNQPYDLLITDLYFEDDGNIQAIIGGMPLIQAARLIQPDLKILVFTASQEPLTISRLYNTLQVDGYVRKARNDAKELELAIAQILRNQRYFPRQLMELMKNAYPFTEFDVLILQLLIKGIRQKDIPEHLRKNNLPYKSLRSIETHLNDMKTALNCTNNEQLIAYCKDNKII